MSKSTAQAPVINGRTVRHVKQSTGTMCLRRNNETDAALHYLRGALTGSTPGDSPSYSMLVRRALAVYRAQIEKQAKVYDLGYEMARVREGTRMPVLHKQKWEGVL